MKKKFLKSKLNFRNESFRKRLVDVFLKFKIIRAARFILRPVKVDSYPWSERHIELFIQSKPNIKQRFYLADHLFREVDRFYARKILSPIFNKMFFSNKRIPDRYLSILVKIFIDSPEFKVVDTRLPDFVERLASQKVSSRQLRDVCNWIKKSKMEFTEKLMLIEKLRNNPSMADNVIYWQVNLDFLLFTLRVDQDEIADVRQFLPTLPYTSEVASNYLLFLTPIRQQGYDEIALQLIESLPRETQSQSEVYFNYLIGNFPKVVSPSDIILPNNHSQLLKFAGVVYPLVGSNPAWAKLFDDAVIKLVAISSNLTLAQKNRIVGQLLKWGRLSSAKQVFLAIQDSSLLINRKLLLGYELFEDGRYSESFNALVEFLSECPSHQDGRIQMRRSGLLAGKSFDELLTLQKQFSESGSINLPNVNTSIYQLRLNGQHREASMERLKTPLYRTLKRFFGTRLLTDQDFKELDVKSSIFIFDHFGVGDFIRVTQVLGPLVDHFEKVTIACDPRLMNILSSSFPKARLVPSSGLRKGVPDGLYNQMPRMSDLNGVLRNYLTQDAGQAMLASDYIVPRVYMEYLVCEPFSHSRRPKGAYYFPEYESPRPLPFDGNRPLKVGLLWRSNLLLGQRKSMYLEINDFASVLDVDGVEFHSVQHRITDSERAYCVANGVFVHDDIDLYNDFDGMSDLLSSLDLVIGISSVPAELAAALGVKVWFLGFSPENFVLRTSGGRTEVDQLTANAINFTAPNIDFSEPVETCIEKVMEETRRRLELLLVRAVSVVE